MSEWLTKNFHIGAERPVVVSPKTREVIDGIIGRLGYSNDGAKYTLAE